MRNYRLIKAFGQIDDIYISQANPETNNNEARNGKMKSEKAKVFFKKPVTIAATVALFICVSGTTVLASTGVLKGFFKNVFGIDGAVIGTSYEHATDEINVQIAEISDNLIIEITMKYPDKMPYSEIEKIGIENYEIINKNNEVIAQGAVEAVAATGDKFYISIPFNSMSEESCKLVISEMNGIKKADLPLTISGLWECEFTK